MIRETTLCLSAALLIAPPALAGGARPLSPDHEGQALDPRWSPECHELSYEVARARERVTELRIVEVSSGREEVVEPPLSAGGVFTRARQVNHELAWSSRGGLYAFASTGSDQQFDLYLKGVTVGLGGPAKEGGPDFSADGLKLVYTSSATGEGDLYLLDLMELERPGRRLTFNEDGLDHYARWSPSGLAIVYAAMGDGGADLRVIDDPSEPQQSDRPLVTMPGNQIKPSWSPNGAYVAFYSDQQGSPTADLYVVDVGGGTPRLLQRGVAPGERRGPAWLPDSSGVVVVKQEPNAGDPLLRVPLLGEPRVLRTGTTNNADPAVCGAPGGWSVAFVSQGQQGADQQGWRRVWLLEGQR